MGAGIASQNINNAYGSLTNADLQKKWQVGETGGTYNVQLQSNNIPSQISLPYGAQGGTNTVIDRNHVFVNGVRDGYASYGTGGGVAHNNIQPYMIVHMWKRTK